MKTKEEILKKHYSKILPNHSKYRTRKDYFSAMDEYASLRESKWRELYEVHTDLIYSLTVVKDLVAIEYITELHQKISEIEQELGLTDKK
jgi:hypothetical protein